MKIKIWINGCFDVLHPGHIRMFEFARSLASDKQSCIKVGIDSDKRVKLLKGSSRPIFDQRERYKMLSALRDVDEVVVFGSDEALEDQIKMYQPDIMIVGSDYKEKKVIGSEFAKKLVFFERDLKYSTSNIVSKIGSEMVNFYRAWENFKPGDMK